MSTSDNITKSNILPFGAQYYRAPTPEPSEWEHDMRAMREAGFNTIKIWAQWRWNQPKEDGYYFDDLDRLMELAEAHGLQVVINTILDCAPAWLYRKHPDCIMITSSGMPVGPVTVAHRPIGGAPGPCFHHREAMAYAQRFVSHVVRRYASHPALFAWDLWNEPELTVGLLREARVQNLVCYCSHSRNAFLQWLQQKYGSLEELNAAWHRNYRDWDELELPINPSAFKDMVDWRMFFIETVTGNMKLRASTAREFDAEHPVMCHTVPMPYFNPITCGSDDWELARCCDIFGNSVGSSPMPADMLRAAARRKTVINAEIHALPGSVFSRPHPIGLEEMKRHILIPLAHGIKGFLYWQYRSELLGGESPAWGLTFPDGSPAPWLEDASQLCRAVTANADFFLNAKRAEPEVALYMSPANQIFCWSASGNTKIYEDSISGAYNALHRTNHVIDFLHPNDVLSDILDERRVLYMPLPYWIEDSVLDRIRAWVESGGNLVAECFFAGADERTGYHTKITPGCGFDAVFGVHEGVVYPESGVLNSYAWKTEGNGGGIPLRLVRDIGDLVTDTVVPGFQVGATLVGTGVETLAVFASGGAAVTQATYGRGTATMIGTLLGAACAVKRSTACASLIAGLVGAHCKTVVPKVDPVGSVRIDILYGPGRKWILVQSITDTPAQAAIELPSSPTILTEMFTGEEIAPENGRFPVTLAPGQVKAYWAR
jgi:beta-galactosidase